MKIENNELKLIIGGASILNGTLLGNIYKIGTKIFEIGQALGSAIRRGRRGILCPI